MAEHDVDEVSLFLGELGLNEDAEKLRKEDVSMEILMEMTTDDLRKMGISFGHSFQIRKALDKSMKTDENRELESRSTTKERTDLDDERASDIASEEESDESLPASSVREKIKFNQQESIPTKFTPTAELEADEFVELDDEVRIVLLGKTGNGKSATGNTILGREGKFTASSSASSVTVECKRGCTTRFKKDFHVIDTPGLFDTQASNKDVQTEIVKCIHITAPGPHAFILVLGLNRFTKEEYDAVTHFVNHFGERIYDYFILLFTRKDDLEYESKTLEDHLKTIPTELKEIVEKCGKRCIAFNNRAKGWAQEQQVKSLLKMIQANILRNGQKYYTDSMYEEATKVMKEREDKIKKEMEERRRREIDEMRKEIETVWKEKIGKQKEMLSASDTKFQELLATFKNKESEYLEYKNSVSRLEKAIKEQRESHIEDTKGLQEQLTSKLEEISKVNKTMSKLENSMQKLNSEREEFMDKIKNLEKDKGKKDKEIEELLKTKNDQETDKTLREEARRTIEESKGVFRRKWHEFRRWVGDITGDRVKEEAYVKKS